MALSGPNPGVLARQQYGVAVVTGKSLELSGQGKTMTLADSTGPADVRPRTILMASLSGGSGTSGENVDPLGGDGFVVAHWRL